MTTDQKGAVAELAIQLAAMKLGIEVYRPVAEGGRFDMILAPGNELIRVQCSGLRGEAKCLSSAVRARDDAPTDSSGVDTPPRRSMRSPRTTSNSIVAS
jgi:PD-(D/E)XK endonuclease